MRILLILLALVSAPAWAEWVAVAENAAGDTIYIDPATIRKSGNVRRAWEVQGLMQRGKGGEISRRVLSEYDCKEERYRILSYSLHSEPMAGGNVLRSSSSSGEWDYIAPDTVALLRFKFVCDK